MKEGKCIRNAEGRLVLPGGGFIPRHINGKDMRERFEEWHRQNPGQLAKGILSSSTIEGLMYNCIPGARVTEEGSTYVGTLRMTPGEEEIYRLERQLNIDDARPGNPNKIPKIGERGITQYTVMKRVGSKFEDLGQGSS